jgi:predicted nucleic acid-binding protein
MTALLDTGFVLALLAENDSRHTACMKVMENEPNPLLPTPILTELAYMVIRDAGYAPFLRFFRFALAGEPRLAYPVAADFSRAADLMEKYADSRLDFVDCAISAMAERLNIFRILTVDQRDFRMIRPSHIPAFEILP